MGREDDLLVMNFMTGGTDISGGAGGISRSNTLNPFTSGSSDQLTQMCVSLMDEAGGDGAVWKGAPSRCSAASCERSCGSATRASST